MDYILCLTICFFVFISRFSRFFSRLGFGSYEEWNPGRKMKILLVGYNGARNTGSDVRVAAIARQIKELFGPEQVQITVMTLDTDSLTGYFDPDVTLLQFSSLFPLDLYRACLSHHAAILCEGSTLKSTFANALTLFLCEAAGIFAAQKKPCIAYGSEIGRMEPFLRRTAARLCRDTYFITRTQESLNELKKLGLHGHAGTDAAWFYDRAILPADAERLLKKQGWDGKTPLLGIAVINPFCWPVRASLGKWIRSFLRSDFSGQYDKWYYFSDSPARRTAYQRYLDEIAAGLQAFMKDRPYFPVLIGMERLDADACRALLARLSCPGALFLSGECSADIMTGILRRLSLLVTSRYHAAVLSMENGCPVTAVSMDERLDSIFRELSFDADYLLHVTDPMLGRKLETALSKAESEQEAIRRQIQEKLASYKSELTDMGSFLKNYMEKHISR